ncbi:MAG TPA: helix-turn-helix transcriptional regulator, partial [Thermodesulfobacteriota bacterium]
MTGISPVFSAGLTGRFGVTNQLGLALRRARKAKGLLQKEAGERLEEVGAPKVSDGAISQYELGDAIPSDEVLVGLARLYGVEEAAATWLAWAEVARRTRAVERVQSRFGLPDRVPEVTPSPGPFRDDRPEADRGADAGGRPGEDPGAGGATGGTALAQRAARGGALTADALEDLAERLAVHLEARLEDRIALRFEARLAALERAIAPRGGATEP